MESAETIQVKCWQFKHGVFREPSYQVLLALYLPEAERWTIPPMSFSVDTGYDGDILLDESLFESLGFSLYQEPSEEWDIGEDVTGQEILLISSRSEIKFEEKTFPVKIETFPGSTENLAGRGLLNRCLFLIDGFETSGCLSVDRSDSKGNLARNLPA